MINKILNNYFTNKLLEEVKWCFIVRGLDYKFEDDKNEVWVKVKPKKYDKEFFSTIISIEKEDSFKYMCNLDKFLEKVRKIIVEYQKDIK